MNDRDFANQYRAKLLSRIPTVQQSIKTKQLISEHQEELKRFEAEWEEQNQNRGMQKMSAAVEVDQLFAMNASEIDKLLEQSAKAIVKKDSASMRMSALLAREFEKFAEKEQDRSAEIIAKLKPDSHAEMAGYILRGLSRSQFDSQMLIEIVRDLNDRGFNTRSVRDDMAHALRGAAEELEGLPNDICELLKEWLGTIRPAEEDEGPAEPNPSSNKEINRCPILWGLGDLVMISHKWYWMGEALKLGLCLREEPKIKEWRDVFDQMIGRPYSNEVFESWLYSETRFSADRSIMATAIHKLLVERPELLGLQVGAVSVVQHAPWLDDNQLSKLIQLQKGSSESRTQQAAGEVSSFIWMRDDRDVCKTFIDEILNSKGPSHQIESVKIGIANSAAHNWTEDSARPRMTELLVRLCKDATPDIVDVILNQTFCQDGCLVDDEYSRNILEVLVEVMNVKRLRDASNLTEQLIEFSQVDPDLTLRVCQAIVNAIKETDDGYRINHGLSESHLVQIALTLHRSSNLEIREKALDLFEDLFDLRAHSAVQGLKELDRRV